MLATEHFSQLSQTTAFAKRYGYAMNRLLIVLAILTLSIANNNVVVFCFCCRALGDVLAKALPAFSLDVVGVVCSYFFWGIASASRAAETIQTLTAPESAPFAEAVFAIAVADGQTVYVGSSAGVHMFNMRDSSFIRQPLGHDILESGTRGIAISTETKEIFVTGRKEDCIFVCDLDGKYIRQFGSKGNGSAEFVCPWGIALDSQGQLWIVDQDNSRVQVMTRDGVFVRKFLGQQGAAVGHVYNPCGIALNAKGFVLGDYANHRLQVCFVFFVLFVFSLGSVCFVSRARALGADIRQRRQTYSRGGQRGLQSWTVQLH